MNNHLAFTVTVEATLIGVPGMGMTDTDAAGIFVVSVPCTCDCGSGRALSAWLLIEIPEVDNEYQ